MKNRCEKRVDPPIRTNGYGRAYPGSGGLSRNVYSPITRTGEGMHPPRNEASNLPQSAFFVNNAAVLVLDSSFSSKYEYRPAG